MTNPGSALREILSSLAVVASLIFVGVEVRQNTQAVQATAIQSLSDAFREQAHLYVSDPQLADVLVRAAQGGMEALTPEEALRLTGFYLSGLMTTQSAYRQWLLGVLPDEEWSVVLSGLCSDMRQPSARVLWGELKGVLLQPFVDAVEDGCNE